MSSEIYYYAAIIGCVAFLAGGSVGWLLGVSWSARRYMCRSTELTENDWAKFID